MSILIQQLFSIAPREGVLITQQQLMPQPQELMGLFHYLMMVLLEAANWVIVEPLQHQFVTGLEVDIQGIAGATRSGPTLIHVNNSNTGAHPVSVESDLIASKTIDYLGTLRGRLGFLATPTMLLSATGGLAYGGVSSRTIIAQSYLLSPGNVQNNWGSTGSYADTRVGWTAGGNLEWMFRPNWSTKIEYLYYDLGTATYNSNNLIAANIGAQVKNFLNNSVSTTTQFNGQLVRIGANYHFS